LSGDVYADLTLKGTISDPALSGGLGLRAATYENLVTGTTLKDLELAVIAEGSNLKIDKMTARTSKGGKIKGSGSINIDPDENFPIDLQVSLSKAMLIQRDDVKAAFDGDIALKGTLAKLLLKGKFETTTAELRFIDNLPPEVVTIDVVEKNLPPSEQKRQREPSSSPIQVDLDLKLSMPDRVFLRSQEIDTEWGGDFTITGTTDKPIIEGTLRPVRGHVSLLGNRFALQQGSISLDGSDELDPLLDLTAVHQKTDLTANVQVQGRLSDPEITLTSTPPLPEDEIISRVLFDKSANALTAAEALELATVVANMARGDPNDGGVLGGVRGALGLDVLSVGASDAGTGAAVSAGRYLADGVYVGVDQGTETDSTKAKVEVDLTPNLTLESGVGADNTGSVGVKWQWDY
jgi:autotransporter translocation and assembly factor TamB